MNKFGMVLGVAAIVTFAGCKDPDYKYGGEGTAQDEMKFAESQPAKPAETPGVAVETASVPKCNCLPGTKHTSPCLCGDPNCKCIVEAPVVPTPPVVKPVEKARGPAYTTYIVQRGDVLSKIAKKYGLKVSDIRTANPRIKKDVIWVGMKLQLPGKIDVGPQAAPVVKSVAKPSVKKPYAPYTGTTKLYVVKAGDTIGGIAYANGLSIRQFKELNGLKKDMLRVGQKVKIPTQKVVAAAKPAAKKADAKRPASSAKAPAGEPAPASAATPQEGSAVPPAAAAAAAAGDQAKAPEAAPVQPAENKNDAPKAAESAPGATYVVQEGDDMTGVSIRWGVSAAAVRELNNLADDAQLVPGQILKLPADAQQ